MKYVNYLLSILKKLVYIVFIVLLILKILGYDLEDVFAYTVQGWGEDITPPKSIKFYTPDGNQKVGTVGSSSTDGFYKYRYAYATGFNTYARIFIFLDTKISSTSAYNITHYVCSSNSNPGFYAGTNFTSPGNSSFTDIKPLSYQPTNFTTLDSQPFAEYIKDIKYCRSITTLFIPTEELTSWYVLGLNSNSAMGTLYYMGFKLEKFNYTQTYYNAIITTPILQAIQQINADGLKQDIINNAEQNKQDIINNQNSNSQNEINNANSNQQQTNDRLDKIDDTMKDDNVDTNSSSGFFNDFDSNSHGLSSMITIPLQYINSWTQSCSPISMPILGENVEISCMSTTYKNKLGNSLYLLIQICVSAPIAYAIISYYIKSVSNAQNPNDNRLEITDL